MASAALRAHPLHRHQQPPPLALGQRPEADQLDQVLAHHHLGIERHRLPRPPAAPPASAPSRSAGSRRPRPSRPAHSRRRDGRASPLTLPIISPRLRDRRRQPPLEPRVVRMAERDRQRVGGVRPGQHHPRQLQPHHVLDLRLLGVADARPPPSSPRSAHTRRRAARLRRHQQRDPARLPELQRPGRVLVDEGLLDRRRLRRPGDAPPRSARRAASRAAPRGRRPPRRTPRSRRGAAACPRRRRRPSRCAAAPGRCRSPAFAGPSARCLARLIARTRNIRQAIAASCAKRMAAMRESRLRNAHESST